MKTKIVNDHPSTRAEFGPKTESRTKVDFSKSEKFLQSLLSKAAEKGYTPAQLVSQCVRIDLLERKYSKSYEELRNDFEELGKEIANKTKKITELEEAISATQKKKADVLREFAVDEKSLKEYVESRAKLSTIGLKMDDLPKVKSCLFSMKNEDFDPNLVIEKLNTIGDLEARKNSLQSQLSAVNGELQEKKVLFIQLRQLQNSGLSVDQIERLRDIVSKISARRGMNADQAMNHFQEDVLKNYDLALGLEGEVMRLQETKNSLSTESEERRKMLEASEKHLQAKLGELETNYETRKAELQAYSELQAAGVDGTRIQLWHQLIKDQGLDYGKIESELKNQGNLKRLEEEAQNRVKDLEYQQQKLQSLVSELTAQKQTVESSIYSMKDGAIKELQDARLAMVSSFTQVAEETKRAMDSAKTDLKTTVSEAGNSVSEFSTNLKSTLKDAGEELKSLSVVVESAEKIGKYEAIMPFLKLNDNGQVSETEALFALWNMSNVFIQWFEKQNIVSSRVETVGLLKKMLSSLNQEMQTVRA